MSSCAYTIDSYITLLTMSSKKRLLVEGRHDRSHLYQLIYKFNPASKVKIDTAQDIKASDKAMSKNNRLKIETIHSKVKEKIISPSYVTANSESSLLMIKLKTY